MRRNIIIAIVLSLTLSSCTTYRDASGNVDVGDSVCSSGACPMLFIATFAALATAVALHK